MIMTPGNWVYLNYSQTRNEDSVTIGGYLPLEKVYSYEPVPAALSADEKKYILGAQGNLWTEYIGNEKIAEYMLFPRMTALSEVLWSKKKDSAGFAKRLMTQVKRYQLWNTNYSKASLNLAAASPSATARIFIMSRATRGRISAQRTHQQLAIRQRDNRGVTVIDRRVRHDLRR